MTADEVLRFLYLKERPVLQTNDWANLRVRVADLVASCCPPGDPQEVIDRLRELRLGGRVMFLPDWNRWGVEEDEEDGTLLESDAQHEPTNNGGTLPSWTPRQVFMPPELTAWFVRSRVAETTRLLFANRERFGLEASTAHLGYELQARERPDRTASPVAQVVEVLQGLAESGEFAHATDTEALKLAIDIVGAGLGYSHIAAFQERAWIGILRCLFGRPRSADATMITAGVSSGKTFGFLLPALTLLVYRALRGEGGRNRVLVIYPRTSLVEDQYHGLVELLGEINRQIARRRPGVSLTGRPALDAGQMLAESIEVDSNSLAETLPQVAQKKIEIILTTPESLKNRMLDHRAVRTYLQNVEIVVFDEIHLMEGLAGCHGIYFIRRLRQLLRDLRGETDYEPAWVGASATVAEPIEHCARVLSLNPSRVAHISPTTNELVRFGTFHHVFLHTRVGKASISAVTNGLSCLVHTRNDCTAFSHYIDPSAAALQHRPSEEIPKTIAFVDSLSTIGRLRFTTADNERTYEPYEVAPPYYSWFYRPAARLGATAAEVRAIGAERLDEVRDWCRKCYHGVPARIDAGAFRASEFSYLRTSTRMDDKAKARATPPGFAQNLQTLRGSIGNLDSCPFHRFHICWWFSQDSGLRRTIGGGQIPIDQNRAIAYTSKTDDPDTGLHQNVNDYFLTESRRLWERAPGIPNTEEAVSVLLASPRIEVGVDFRNVRDGATHKALRSAASFQQKVGRVGREDNSDSLVVTFLAHRPTDAHFAHQPGRLIDAAHLDPIPLKSENQDVLRNHMFAAALEFIASRRHGIIAGAGNELGIIGPGSNRVPDPWEDKVRGCIGYISANRVNLRTFILAATGQEAGRATSIAEEAIDSLLNLLSIFVADLTGVYSAGRTAAHWFKENHPPNPTSGFSDVLAGLDFVAETLGQASIGIPPTLRPDVDRLRDAASTSTPVPSDLNSAAASLKVSTVAAIPAGLPTAVAALLLSAISRAEAVAGALGSLTLQAPLMQLRHAHAIIQAFFEESDPGQRTIGQYYLHDILNRLLPFRKFYPFGLVRTHFQHVNARQVRILFDTGEEEPESLATALYELLPGTWNYRWLQPRKSPCGRIDRLGGTGEHFANLSNIEGLNKAAFELTGATLAEDELPADMPAVGPDARVPILRPVRLRMERSYNRPDARYDNQLIGDDDEAARVADPQFKRLCPTLPRAFPATWYRVMPDPAATAVVGEGDPSNSGNKLRHLFPALGRVVFERVTFSSRLRTDRYAYALDRSYGSGGIESPRIYYRHGNPHSPVVLGESLGSTDGLTFRLKPSTLDSVVGPILLTANRTRGEITIRALRRFIARCSGCGPFQAEMVIKVILSECLDAGATLETLDAGQVLAGVRGITRNRYDDISGELIDGIYAGVDPAEAGAGRGRQAGWYDDAWSVMQQVQARISDFSPIYVGETARDMLVHTLSVTVLDGASRLVGAADGDLGYFHRADRGEFYIFDSVEGGNGCAETVARFLHIPPLRRIIAAQQGASAALPSADGFMLIEEAMGTCPAQCATRLLVETCRNGVADPAHLRFPRGLVADLQARIRHEYDPVTGARAIVDYLFQSQPTLFADWLDLLWLQVVPERFASTLVTAGVCSNIDSLRARTHLCVTGCLECVDNGDQSIYGALTSREFVSRNLLDALRRHVVAEEPQAFVRVPPGTNVGAVLQANAGLPVTDASGTPVNVTIEEQGTQRRVLLTRVLSTVSPDFGLGGGGSLLTSTGAGTDWEVNVPFVAAYRDERPTP